MGRERERERERLNRSDELKERNGGEVQKTRSLSNFLSFPFFSLILTQI